MKREIDIKKELGLKIKSPFSIIDVEITNDISSRDGGQWRYDDSDVCCVGFLKDDKIIQFWRESDDPKEVAKFKADVIEFMQPLNLFAFNQNMERGSLNGYFQLKGKFIQEIKPFKGRGWSKEAFYNEMINKALIKPLKLTDPLANQTAIHCQELFKEGKHQDILSHNICCLIKEYFILANRDALYNLHKNRIDSVSGWYK